MEGGGGTSSKISVSSAKLMFEKPEAKRQIIQNKFFISFPLMWYIDSNKIRRSQ
jgi:hypothetical protein